MKKKGIWIAGAALALAILLAVAGALLGGRQGPIQSGFQTLMRPFGQGAAAVADFFEDIYGYMYRQDSLRAENELLKQQLAELEDQARRADQILEENTRLRELLDFTARRESLSMEAASVISRSASNWSRTITISKGSDHGLALLDAVITEAGALVGQISELSAGAATVRLITDPAFSAGVLVDRTGDTALASGYFDLMTKGRLRLEHLESASGAVQGDVVLTSGQGGTMPAGLVIGSIVSGSAAGGGRQVVLQPRAALENLQQVFVITDFKIVE